MKEILRQFFLKIKAKFYNKTEIDSKLDGKSDNAHKHDDIYYAKNEIDTKLSKKSDTEHTHTKSQITDFPTSLKNPNALTVNGKTYDGSSAVDAGVQKIENGGTGATTAKDAFENLANGLPEGAGPLDTEHIIFQNENRKNWGLYTLSQFWEYIKSKISSKLVIPIGAPSSLEDGCIWIG